MSLRVVACPPIKTMTFEDEYPLGIRYSPYQSPFVPSSPKGVYWIGAELRDVPHSAHVWVYNHHLGGLTRPGDRTAEQVHLEAVLHSATAFRRPFLSICSCPWCEDAARKMTSAPVAVPVTPPLSPMGGNRRHKQAVF